MSDVLSIEQYIEKAGLKGEKTYSKEETAENLNEHVISLYKGRVNVKEEREYTGFEIAEILHNIHQEFHDRFMEAWEEEFGEEE